MLVEVGKLVSVRLSDRLLVMVHVTVGTGVEVCETVRVAVGVCKGVVEK